MLRRCLNGRREAGAKIRISIGFPAFTRDVYLYTVPDVHIRDLRVRAIPDRTLSKGKIEICTET